MRIYQENDLYGLKSDCGDIIITPQYRDFYPFSCGLACVRNPQYQYAYIDTNNVAIIPFGKYIWVDPYFTCGYARVKGYSDVEKRELWGIINTLGMLIVPLHYDNIWTINEKYIDNLKAYKNGKECRINLRTGEKHLVLNGLRYIKTYTIDEFKAEFNVNSIFVRHNPHNHVVSFYYGTNIGIVSNDNPITDPVISVVCNSAGKIFCLLHHRKNINLQHVRIIKRSFKPTDSYTENDVLYNDYDNYVDDIKT